MSTVFSSLRRRRALALGSALASVACLVSSAGCSSSSHGNPAAGGSDAAGAGADAAAGDASAQGTEGGSPGGEAGSSDDGGTAGDGAAAVDAAEAGPGIYWLGRVAVSADGGAQFAWSGTGLVTSVTGTSISVKLRTTGASAAVYFQPVVDGTPGTRFGVPNGEQTVTLASNVAANLPDGGPHIVELYRETEGRYGVSTFEGFTEGTVGTPPAASGRLIEIVGDSISAGYGALGSEQHPNYGPDPDGGCQFSTQTESAYVTYGVVAAQTLHADWSVVAVSGWGMYRDNGNSTANVLPAVYADEFGLTPTPAWSFQPEPQAVVINLGTNDFANGDPGQTQFENAYTAFIATVRGKYPDAWIFCTVGPLLYPPNLTTAQTYIQAVVAAANSGGDMKVKYLDFGQQNTSLGTGCQYHPNVTEHTAMATKLVAALHTALGW